MKLYPEEQKESTVMNTIKIKGYASRKVNADRIRYTIGFISKDVKASRASEQVKKQCDIFLKDMKDLGFNVSKLHLDGDAIEKEYGQGEQLPAPLCFCRSALYGGMHASRDGKYLYHAENPAGRSF